MQASGVSTDHHHDYKHQHAAVALKHGHDGVGEHCMDMNDSSSCDHIANSLSAHQSWSPRSGTNRPLHMHQVLLHSTAPS